MLTSTLDLSGLRSSLDADGVKVLAALRGRLESETGQLANYIKAEKLSGQVLKNRTGNLRNSVFYTMEDRGAVFVGTVDVSMPAAKYGAAHEFGAHIPERVPVSAKALHWIAANGQSVFAMRAAAFDLPVRSFMNSALEDRRTQITANLQETVNEAVS